MAYWAARQTPVSATCERFRGGKIFQSLILQTLRVVDRLSWIPERKGEHLISQLFWVAAWILVTCVCPVYLGSERRLLFWRCLFVVGRKMSWERWDSSKLGRWERCMTWVKWQGGKCVSVEWGDKLGRVTEQRGDTIREVGTQWDGNLGKVRW